MRKPRKIIEVQCINCGGTFLAKARSNLRCEECKEEWARQRKSQFYQREKTQKTKSLKTHPKMSIREVIKTMEKYNREHKTHYTYGQFVMLMESGKI